MLSDRNSKKLWHCNLIQQIKKKEKPDIVS